MEISSDEKIVLLKYRQARKYAEDNKQAELEIRIYPGGKDFIARIILQEKHKTAGTADSGQ